MDSEVAQMDPEVSAMAAVVGAVKRLSPDQLRLFAATRLPTADQDLTDLATATEALQTAIQALRGLPDQTQRQALARFTAQRFAPVVEAKAPSQGARRGPRPKDESLRKVG